MGCSMTKPRCKRCGGNLFIGLDESNHITVTCLQCGWVITGKRINPLKRMGNPHSLSHYRMVLRRKDKNLCTRCATPVFGIFLDCLKCRKIKRKERKAYELRHLKIGLCTRCSRPVKPGCKHCQVCLDKVKRKRPDRYKEGVR